jgi:hypothetical protein
MSLENAHSAIQNISHEFAAFLAKVSPDLDALRREEGYPIIRESADVCLRQAFSDELENLFSETFGRVRDRLDGRGLMDRAA